QWGRAEPLATTVPVTDLAAALEDGAWTLLVRVGDAAPLDLGERLADNAAAIVAAEADGSYRRFVEAHSEPDEPTLDNLTLQTWLLARNRSLHARWLADQEELGDLPERFESQVVAAWRRAAAGSRSWPRSRRRRCWACSRRSPPGSPTCRSTRGRCPSGGTSSSATPAACSPSSTAPTSFRCRRSASARRRVRRRSCRRSGSTTRRTRSTRPARPASRRAS